MIRNPYYLKYILRVNPDLVMHIGGHRGQDGHNYQVIMKEESRIIWAEPDIANAQVIQEKYPSQKVLTDVFWSEKNMEINFYKTKDSEKSSAKKPIDMLTETVVEEITLRTTTIDSEIPKDTKKCLLVLDVQGGEIEVLRGASGSFNHIKWIVLEVTSNGVEYENVPTEIKLDSLLKSKGFRKSNSRISHNGDYKDQLYLRDGKVKSSILMMVDLMFIQARQVSHVFRFGHLSTTEWYCSQCKR